MIKKLTTLIVLLFVSTTVHAKGLVIIGMDGAGLGTIQKLMDQDRLPNLQKFLNGFGKLYPVLIPGLTVTSTSWAKIFTGLDDYQNGVRGNKSCSEWTFNPDRFGIYDTIRSKFHMAECFERVIPLKQTMQGALLENGIACGWFASKVYLGNNPNRSPFSNIVNNCTSVRWWPETTEDYLYRLRDETLKFMNDNKDKSFVAFIHLNPDYWGHKVSIAGLRYEEEIVRVDSVLGDLMKGMPADTKIMVITDHGFDSLNDPSKGFQHDNGNDGWLVSNLPIDRRLRKGGISTLDITPTVLAWFNVPYNMYHRKGRSVLR